MIVGRDRFNYSTVSQKPEHMSRVDMKCCQGPFGNVSTAKGKTGDQRETQNS